MINISNDGEYRYYYLYLEKDGIDLFTVICLPKEGEKFPVVIHRNPYVDKEEPMSETEICEKKLQSFSNYLKAGYAVVFQHCRGRGKSSGDCIPFIYEREDGLFLQSWVREQPFYNGEIYLCGASYTATVHFVTPPFASDIKGAVLEVQDCERYNISYRNGFFKMGLLGGWYVNMYKAKSKLNKSYTTDSFRLLPLSDFSKTVLGECAEDFDQTLRHPDKNDDFWLTRFGGAEARDAIKNAGIPILLVTGFYDIYTGGVFDMWRGLDEKTRSLSALAVHPYGHGGTGDAFENGILAEAFEDYRTRWLDSIRGKCKSPFDAGKVTYYCLYDNKWHSDVFYDATRVKKIGLGEGSVTYKYNPYAPASFKGGLSGNFGGAAWQDLPNSRYDIISFYSDEFSEDTCIKGKIRASLEVSSDCEDTCFYMRLSICKPEGDYGLRDDINKISNFEKEYKSGERLRMTFSFDEHAFTVKKGEKIRIDISSSAYPYYVPHTNRKGLFSEQPSAKVATNTVFLDNSYVELPVL